MRSRPLAARLGLLLLCAPYLQGGLLKALDFPAAIAEMHHFGLQPAPAFALAVIVLELGAAALVVADRWRAASALALAAFTLAATLLANRFWELGPPDRFAATNAFFEHLALAGAWLRVASGAQRQDRARRESV